MSNRSEAQARQTTVEEGTSFKGTLTSTCQVLVRGVVDGDLTAPSVVISDTGTVVGNVKAQTIRSEGVLAGKVDADDVQLSGNVRSNTVIRARTLEVKLQRSREKLEVTFGECILDVGDDPNLETSEPVQAGGKSRRPAEEAKPSDGTRREEGEEGGGNHRSAPPPPS